MILNLIGFESGSLDELVSYNATLSTSVKRTGSYSMKMTQYGNYGEVGLASGSSFSGRIGIIRFYFQITSPGMMGSEEICRFHNSSNNINLRINPGMNLQLFSDTSVLGTYTTSLSTGTWYRIELACFPGRVVLLVNGTQALSVSTTTYNWTNLFIGSYVNRNSQFVSCYFDDICLTDDFFPGAGEIYNLQPTSMSGWTGSYTSLYDNNTATAITNSSSGTVATIGLSAYDNTKTIRAVKPWIKSKDGSVTIKTGSSQASIANPASYGKHIGLISTSKNQAYWNSQPDFTITNDDNVLANIAEAGVMIEYGSQVTPSVTNIYDTVTTIPNSADPVFLQFTFKYTGNATIVDIGNYKLTISNNNIKVMTGALTASTGTTTLSPNTFYTVKFYITKGTAYRLLINNIEEINSTYTTVFATGDIVFSGLVTVKSVCLTKDLWFNNAEVVVRSPIGNGSVSNYTGSYVDVAEYPVSTAEYVTLNSGSGGAYFAVSSVSTSIYAVKEVIVADSGFNAMLFGEPFTTAASNEAIRQSNVGDSWITLPELKIDYSGSVSSKLYGTYYLVLAEKGSTITAQTVFFLFT